MRYWQCTDGSNVIWWIMVNGGDAMHETPVYDFMVHGNAIERQ